MHLATTILRRFTEAFQRANLFVLLLFWRATFFGTFPARNVKVSSTLSLNSYGWLYWLDPNIVTYAKKGRERAVPSNVRAVSSAPLRTRTRAVPKLVWLQR